MSDSGDTADHDRTVTRRAAWYLLDLARPAGPLDQVCRVAEDRAYLLGGCLIDPPSWA